MAWNRAYDIEQSIWHKAKRIAYDSLFHGLGVIYSILC